MLTTSSFAPCKARFGVIGVPLTLAITVAAALMVILRHGAVGSVFERFDHNNIVFTLSYRIYVGGTYCTIDLHVYLLKTRLFLASQRWSSWL